MSLPSSRVDTPRHVARAFAPRIELLPDLAALRAHQAQWFSLWRNTPDATPFQSPAWLLCWAKHYAPDRTGAIAVLDGGELLALLPYFTWNDTVWLAGTGTSDYGDWSRGARRSSSMRCWKSWPRSRGTAAARASISGSCGPAPRFFRPRRRPAGATR